MSIKKPKIDVNKSIQVTKNSTRKQSLQAIETKSIYEDSCEYKTNNATECLTRITKRCKEYCANNIDKWFEQIINMPAETVFLQDKDIQERTPIFYIEISVGAYTFIKYQHVYKSGETFQTAWQIISNKNESKTFLDVKTDLPLIIESFMNTKILKYNVTFSPKIMRKILAGTTIKIYTSKYTTLF